MSPKEIEYKYALLLSDSSFENLNLILKKPNIFYILKLAHHEIRHSNFLSWLLSPNESHGLGNSFLFHFLREILLDDRSGDISVVDLPKLVLQEVQIKREWKNIDILIQFKELIIVVENKLYSDEHSNQLEKYKLKIEEEFPEHKKIYVLLSTTGKLASDSKVYVEYSYEKIINSLNNILKIFDDSLNTASRIYIKDYLVCLNALVMKNSEANGLAAKIYANHSLLLDFIFQNKPDPAQDFKKYFEEIVVKSGWILTSPGKGYVRFLTPKLSYLIPKTGQAWPNKEAFLFEIDFLSNQPSGKVRIYCTIAPGEENIRKVLRKAIESIEGSKKITKAEKWLSHFGIHPKFSIEELIYEDPSIIREKINSFWSEVEALVSKVEQGILTHQDELISIFPSSPIIHVTGKEESSE